MRASSDVEPHETYAIVTARVAGRDLIYRLGAPGRHLALNSLAVLLAAQACRARSGDRLRESLASFEVPRGPRRVASS